MPISDSAIDALPLGKDVYDDLTYCLSQWQEAGYKAAMALPDPEDPNATVDWVITLIGNLAWAATVFFPPASAVGVGAVVIKGIGPASVATKATSMLGATLAAGTIPKLRELGGNLNSPQGKKFLDDYIGSQVPDVLKAYAAEADPWVQKDLLSHLISQFSLRTHPDPKQDNDAAFTRFYNSVAGGEERRRYVWEDYVFPGFMTRYDNHSDLKGGQKGLQNLLFSQLTVALRDFDQQWKTYIRYVDLNKGKRFGREMVENYLKNVPFNPVLRFKGVPEKLLALQEQNRRNLKIQFGTK